MSDKPFKPFEARTRKQDIPQEPASSRPVNYKLGRDLPIDDTEAEDILNRMSKESNYEEQIKQLESENAQLRDELEKKSAESSVVIEQLRSAEEALKAFLRDEAHKHIREISQHIIDSNVSAIIEEKISAIMDELGRDALFYANASTLDKLGISLIKLDEAVPADVVVCQSQGKRYLLEI